MKNGHRENTNSSALKEKRLEVQVGTGEFYVRGCENILFLQLLMTTTCCRCSKSPLLFSWFVKSVNVS